MKTFILTYLCYTLVCVLAAATAVLLVSIMAKWPTLAPVLILFLIVPAVLTVMHHIK